MRPIAYRAATNLVSRAISADPRIARNRSTRAAFLLLGVMGLADPSVGIAQDVTAAGVNSPVPNASQEVPDIIVTAQKRSTSLQKTPISITALNGAQLSDHQVRSLTDVQQLVPGLKVGSAQGYAQINIRGTGSSGTVSGTDPTVAVNINDVYAARSSSVLASLYDISTIEVLRGPQGTLYGRNATAGAINIATVRPSLDDWSGYVKAGVGNYMATDDEVAIGGPIVKDKLAVRIAAMLNRHDGYGHNLVTGSDINNLRSEGVRATILWAPADELRVTLIGDYYYERDRSNAPHYFSSDSQTGLPNSYKLPPASLQEGGFVPSNVRDIADGVDPELELKTYSATGMIDWRHGPFTIRSITAYRGQKFGQSFGLDLGSVGSNGFDGYTIDGEPAHQFSQELQFHYDTNRLHATGGLYYFHEHLDGITHALFDTNFIYPYFKRPAPTPAYVVNVGELSGVAHTNAKAVFGEIDYLLLDRLTVIGGLRYSDESKGLFSYASYDFALQHPFPLGINPLALSQDITPLHPGVAKPTVKFHSVTPRAVLQFQATPRTMLYASYAKGFKSGGYDTTAANPAYQPEKLDSYEVGVKTGLFQGRLQIDGSLFHNKYSDLQVQELIGVVQETQNAARATINGADVQLTGRLPEDVSVQLNGSYLHATYDSYIGSSPAQPVGSHQYNFSGNRLNNAPKFTGYAAVEKGWPLADGRLSARAEAEYSSLFYFTPDNIPLLSQGSFLKGNMFLTYKSEHGWNLTAYVRNVSNATTKNEAHVLTSIVGAPIGGNLAPPRTFGVEGRYSF